MRVLLIGSGRAYISPPPVVLSDIETALPHLTLFKNLRELALPHVDLKHPPLSVLVPIFSSFAGTLKRLRWAQEDPVHETWEAIGALADHLPNLTYINLSGYDWGRYNYENNPQCEIQIQLSADVERPLAINHFKFHELRILLGMSHSVRPFLESCARHLQVLDLNRLEVRQPDER